MAVIAWLIDLEAPQIHERSLKNHHAMIGKQQWQRRLLYDPEDIADPTNIEETTIFHHAQIADKHTTYSNSSRFNQREHAIFLISFGESAAKSSILERAILAIRRRGEFYGPVAVLTDAPSGRYEGLFDENVSIVRPKVLDTQMKFHFGGLISSLSSGLIMGNFISIYHSYFSFLNFLFLLSFHVI